MNKKVIGLLLAGVVAISVGGVGRTVYAATDINSAAVSESVNSYVDLQVPALSAGVYDVNVNLLKSGTESTSMAQDMIDGAELVVEDGETTLVIYAKAIKKWGITGHAETLNYFDGDIKYAANIVEKEDGNPTAFSFKLPSKGLTSNKFKVTMTTDVNVLGVSMGKELSADMQIDFSKIK